MDTEAAYTLIENAISAGRPAHGYLIVGDVRGAALELAERVLERLFGALAAERGHMSISLAKGSATPAPQAKSQLRKTRSWLEIWA